MSQPIRDVPALVAALAVLALGVVLLLDATDVVHLRLAVLAPLFLAVIGAILLAVGLDRSAREVEPPA